MRRAAGPPTFPKPPLVRVGKQLAGSLDVERLLLQGLPVPLASRRAEEVATIDVDGAGEDAKRVRHRVDHRLSEQRGVPGLQLLASRNLQTRGASAIERIVLPPPVEPDQRSHAVIVRIDRHARRPDNVQDSEIASVVED